MASIFLRNGVWQIKFKRAGRWRYRSLKTRIKREADRLKADIEKALTRERNRARGIDTNDTIAEVAELYLKHVEAYYRRADGTPTQAKYKIISSIESLVAKHPDLDPMEFGPRRLKDLRRDWIESGLARSTVNGYTGEIRRFFKWAVSEELVDVSVHAALSTVRGLRAAEEGVRDTAPIMPVPYADIQAVRKKLSTPLRGLVDTQYQCAARGGELLMLRPQDFDTSHTVWTVDLAHHKTRHRGHDHTLYFGPKAQEILEPFMSSHRPEDFLFSPREAEAERYGAARIHRRPGQAPTAIKTDRIVGNHYTSDSYRQAIVRACKKAGVTPWTPHQLRHSRAQQIRDEYGAEAANAILGQRTLDATLIYAPKTKALAMRIALESG